MTRSEVVVEEAEREEAPPEVVEPLDSVQEAEQPKHNHPVEPKAPPPKTTAAKPPKQQPCPTDPATFNCEFCPKSFLNSRQLGGHVSKAHPGRSRTYQQKIIKRESRTKDRELVYATRDYLNENLPDNAFAKSILFKFRVAIKKHVAFNGGMSEVSKEKLNFIMSEQLKKILKKLNK